MRALSLFVSALAFLLLAAPASAQQVLADSGFEAPQDGYSFPNFGEGHTNLTSDEMIDLFGVRVCSAFSEGECVLTPEAEKWMEDNNQSMSGGHCYGMAFTAQRFFEGYEPSQDLFGAPTTPELVLDNNPDLSSYISYAWSLQNLPAVQATATNLPPKKVARFLESRISPGVNPYVITIYGPQGGHAITPLRVELIGPGKKRIAVYDNNWPGQTRYIHINTRLNKWRYQLAPSITWKGNVDTKSLQLQNPSVGLSTQPCFICPPKGKAKDPRRAELRLTSNQRSGWHGSLVATDQKGRKAGFTRDGRFNKIPGVKLREQLTARPWRTETPPVLSLPTRHSYNVALGGLSSKGRTNEEVSLVSQGTSVSVKQLAIRRGEEDHLKISKNLKRVSFVNDSRQVESPQLTLTTSSVRGGADYLFQVDPVGVNRGEAFSASLNAKKRFLLLHNKSKKTEEVQVTEVSYSAQPNQQTGVVKLKPGEKRALNF